ncbi:MlaD family protein [Nocardia nova]|uniref:MlaD family protein n=1 Tax=Nocardia nova TaxID=37330 RepID=UPI0033F4877D
MRSMAKYGMPGVAMSSRGSRRTGVAAVAVVALTLIAGVGYRSLRTGDGTLRVQVIATRVGDGIVTGSDVRLDGLRVGSVESIATAGPDRLRMTLALNGSRLPGVTDSLSLRAAPGNLFGIAEIDIARGAGGRTLRPGTVIDLTGTAAGRMSDATMGALLRQLSRTTAVLTPELSDVLRRAGTDLKAFAPIIRAMVSTARDIADTQRYAPSYLLRQYGSVLGGLPPFLSGTIQLLYSLNHLQALRADRSTFDKTVAAITDELFPAVTRTSATARQYLGGYAEFLAPLLTAVGHTVPAPEQSSAELHELLNRWAAAMSDGPDGPTLNLKLTLSGVPVLSSALLGPVTEAGR